MAQAITVSGDRRVMRMLNAKGAKAIDLEPVYRGVADYAERQIQRVPRDTGRLVASTRGGPEQLRNIDRSGFDLGTTVPYAGYAFRRQPAKINSKAIGKRAGHDVGNAIDRAR